MAITDEQVYHPVFGWVDPFDVLGTAGVEVTEKPDGSIRYDYNGGFVVFGGSVTMEGVMFEVLQEFAADAIERRKQKGGA